MKSLPKDRKREMPTGHIEEKTRSMKAQDLNRCQDTTQGINNTKNKRLGETRSGGADTSISNMGHQRV